VPLGFVTILFRPTHFWTRARESFTESGSRSCFTQRQSRKLGRCTECVSDLAVLSTTRVQWIWSSVLTYRLYGLQQDISYSASPSVPPNSSALTTASLLVEIFLPTSYAQLSGQEKKDGLCVQQCTGRGVTLGFRSALEGYHYTGNMQVAYKFITASPSGMISMSITCGRRFYMPID
jgi:hypothetical protein